MANYETLIPDSMYSEYIPTGGKYDFLYIGRGSIEKMRDEWMKNAEAFAACGKESDSVITRMGLVAEAQYCRGRAKMLDDLAVDAESKPSIFRELPTQIGSRITCATPETKGAYAHCVLTQVLRGDEGELIYEVRVVDERPRFRKLNQTIRFCPDLLSVIPTDDWPYLKYHPNFFKLYLSVYADSPSARKRVKEAVAAVN